MCLKNGYNQNPIERIVSTSSIVTVQTDRSIKGADVNGEQKSRIKKNRPPKVRTKNLTIGSRYFFMEKYSVEFISGCTGYGSPIETPFEGMISLCKIYRVLYNREFKGVLV